MICRHSPDEQSYLVKYPRRLSIDFIKSVSTSLIHTYLSSTFALPNTSNPPTLPRTQGKSWANIYARTILNLAYTTVSSRVFT